MKKIKEAIIKGDSRSKGLVVALVAYLVITGTTILSGATSQITDYIQTVAIHIKDGGEDTKDYLVKQDTVENVLDELEIDLSQQDEIDYDLEYIVNRDDLLTITRITNAVVSEDKVIESENVLTYDGLHLFTSEVVQQGQDGLVTTTYDVTYQNGQEVSRELTNTEVVSEATDTITSVGTVQAGAYFSGKLTTYGGDCVGCSGYGASGVKLSATTGVNGNGTGQLYYNGNWYYCLAADPSIPFGTIIEISNHNLSLSSTFYGIVVDRGGAIIGNKIDIFKGSQTGGTTYFSGPTTYDATYKIISVGSGRNFWR